MTTTTMVRAILRYPDEPEDRLVIATPRTAFWMECERSDRIVSMSLFEMDPEEILGRDAWEIDENGHPL